MAEYVIAKYLRLSLDDEKSSSMSIEHQRAIVGKHIDSLDIADAEVVEFVDNGYSGTNFERPAVQQLLELVRTGGVNCIIVKDFSRFGRSAIDSGYFLEKVFPLYRIRFISVTDDFDSSRHIGDTGGIDVALKLIVNEYYSRDLSNKIKTAKKARMLRGEYIMENCVHGYKKVENRMEVDEPAAESIRFIFDLAFSGVSLTGIATHLYENKHPTPAEYQRKARKGDTGEKHCIWNTSVIHSILTNEVYTGTYISGKTRSIEVGSKKSVPVDESEWIKIPDHHPAIVDNTVFEAIRRNRNCSKKANPKRKSKTRERYSGSASLLKGKVFCGYCGHAMYLSSTKNASFQCSHTRAAPDATCYRFHVSTAELEVIASKHLTVYAQELVYSSHEPQCQESLLSQLISSKCKLYERYVSSEICADEFKREKATLDAEYDRVKQAQDTFNKETEKQKSQLFIKQAVEDIHKKGNLTKEFVDLIISNIHVYKDSKIDITWNHA